MSDDCDDKRLKLLTQCELCVSGAHGWRRPQLIESNTKRNWAKERREKEKKKKISKAIEYICTFCIYLCNEPGPSTFDWLTIDSWIYGTHLIVGSIVLLSNAKSRIACHIEMRWDECRVWIFFLSFATIRRCSFLSIWHIMQYRYNIYKWSVIMPFVC